MFENVLNGVVVTVATFFVSAIPMILLYKLTNLLWKSEHEANTYPCIMEFSEKGWKIGAKPSASWLGND